MSKGVVLRIAAVAAVGAVALFAFFAVKSTGTAQANGVSNVSCSLSPSPFQLGTPEVATCTFDFAGTTHTLVVDFSLTPGQQPPLDVTSCTLDGTAIHVGPCP